MTKFGKTLALAAAALFVSGGAFAATLQPAAGMQPYFNQMPATSSTLARSTVQAQASQPSAGNVPFFEQAAASQSTLTRGEVEAQAASHKPVAGELTAMGPAISSGNLSL